MKKIILKERMGGTLHIHGGLVGACIKRIWSDSCVDLLTGDGRTYTSIHVRHPGERVAGIHAVWFEPFVSSATHDEKAEQAIDQAGANKAPRVTPFEVEAQIRGEFYFTASDGVLGESEMGTRPAAWTNLDQVTICVLILRNGTKVVGVNEGPVSRENFSAEIGRQYARQKAMDQIWPMLGYELRTKLATGCTAW